MLHLASLKRTSMARRRTIVMRLWLANFGSQEAIAEALKGYGIEVDHVTVSRDIKEMTEQYDMQAALSVAQLRAIELQKLDNMERETVESIERLEACLRDVNDSDVVADLVAVMEKVAEIEKLRAKHQEILVKIQGSRRSMVGLDAATKSELTGKDGGPIQVEDARAKLLGKLGE